MTGGGVRVVNVAEDQSGQRLDRWLRRAFPVVPQSLLQRLLRSGQIRVEGKRVKADFRLDVGQSVRLPPQISDGAPKSVPRPPPGGALLEALREAILFEDDWVLALNKPAGLAVQGGSGQTQSIDRLAAGLMSGKTAPRLAHRLDRDTSGVLLLAKRADAARSLAAAFKGRTVRKLYYALVQGVPKQRGGRIAAPLVKRGAAGRQRIYTDAEGQDAETLFALADKAGGKASLLVLAPLTGRTHQIRAHLAAIRHPILGDLKYGAGKNPTGTLSGLMLHAAELAVPHPEDGTTLRVAAPPPPAFQETCRVLGLRLDGVAGALEQLELRGG